MSAISVRNDRNMNQIQVMQTTINTNKFNLKVSAFGEEKNLVESKMNVIKFNSVEITFKLPLFKLSQMCRFFAKHKTTTHNIRNE